MQGKRISKGILEEGLKGFLEDPSHLIFGYGRDKGLITHKVFVGSLEDYCLFSPYFGFNGANIIRRIFAKAVKVLMLLRPCEIRAIIELIKLNQIETEAIITVSMDCPGTCSLAGAKEGLSDDPFEVKGYLADNADSIRWACSVCRERRGVVGDAGIRMTEDGGLWVIPYTEKAEGFMGLIDSPLEDVKASLYFNAEGRTEPFKTDMAQFSSDLSKCILCKNCRDMCPVCYCIDCLFNGDEYLPKGDALVNKVIRGGSEEMPSGKELFHMIRLYHVSQTCVGCGSCEEACPHEIPLTRYFKGISERLQALFSYMSGRAVDEPIPYVTFLEDELKDAED